MRSGSCSLPMPAAVMHSAAGGQTGATIRPIPRKGVDSPHPRRCSSARAIPRRMRFLPRRAGRKPTACRKRSPALRTWSPARDQGPEVTPTGVAPLFRPDAPDRSTHAGCGKSRGQVAASPSVIGGPGHAPSRRCRWIAGDDDGARPDPTGSWAGPISVAGGPRPDPADRGRARPDGGLVRQTPRPGGSLDGAALGHHATPTPGRPGCRAPSPGGGGLRRVRPGLLTSSATRGLAPKPVVERRSIHDGSGSAECSPLEPTQARPGGRALIQQGSRNSSSHPPPTALLDGRMWTRPTAGAVTRQEPGHTDHRGLPAGQPAGSTGIYAIGLMCDSTEPEEAKRAAYTLLALLTATPAECLRLT